MNATVSCPTCRRPVASAQSAAFPFCSARCRLIDLGRWATGSYVIAGQGIADAGDPPGRDRPEAAP